MKMSHNPEVAGKKLLLIGGVFSASDMIPLCHRNQISLGVTDYNDQLSIMKIADEAFNVDCFDVDGIVQLCKSEGYEGVITEYVDRLLPIAADVADKLGAHSPFTKEQIEMSTNKDFFKKLCIKYDVPVPTAYEIKNEDDINDEMDIVYPVIVKPVDNSSSRGLCICKNSEELKNGLKEAKKSSHSGRVIVEDYLPYDEINVTYIAQNGDIQLAAIHDRYFNESQEGVMKVPDMYIYPSKYTKVYYDTVNDKVINMLKEIGIKNGSLFMQAVVRDGQVYFYEAGMRLNGCKTYEILEYENDYNTLEHLIYYCLTGNMGKYQKFDARFKKWYATWNVVGIPGKICNKFLNVEALNTYPWLIKIGRKYVEGDKIRENSAGTLLQLVARIHLMADSKEQLLERIEKVQKLFDVVDESGESVLLKGHDIEDLRKRINYDL